MFTEWKRENKGKKRNAVAGMHTFHGMSKSTGSRISHNFPASKSLGEISLTVHLSAFFKTSATSRAVKLMTGKPYEGENPN